MKQMSLKLNTYIRSVSVINNNIEKIALNFILWSFFALSIFYILFLGNMVGNIVERRSLEKEALALSNEVGNLELEYLSLWNNIDFTLSQTLGFKETKAIFTARKSIGLNVEPRGDMMSPNDL
ncbi:hypothetical protein HYZ82_02430 [Candidatus Nomurabacteria bacterium]|nr:hypothetical protein [Candidatus Nomurabacteria bacterium]